MLTALRTASRQRSADDVAHRGEVERQEEFVGDLRQVVADVVAERRVERGAVEGEGLLSARHPFRGDIGEGVVGEIRLPATSYTAKKALVTVPRRSGTCAQLTVENGPPSIVCSGSRRASGLQVERGCCRLRVDGGENSPAMPAGVTGSPICASTRPYWSSRSFRCRSRRRRPHRVVNARRESSGRRGEFGGRPSLGKVSPSESCGDDVLLDRGRDVPAGVGDSQRDEVLPAVSYVCRRSGLVRSAGSSSVPSSKSKWYPVIAPPVPGVEVVASA
jgi:hypothetical protein